MLRRPDLVVARALALTCCGLLLAGCLTGKRPYFPDDPLGAGNATGDPAIDKVLHLFDGVTTGPVTANYDVLVKFGITNTAATVVLDTGKRQIVVGDVRYVQTPSHAQTCTTDDAAPCTEGWDATRISDTLLTVDFYSTDTAKRLRRDAQSKAAPTTSRTESIGGVDATCVDVPLGEYTAVYCAAANGMLVLLDDGDLRIELTSMSTDVDQKVFRVRN